MQTFLPYPGYHDSARVLDRQRLGKQRVETLQIMKALVLGVGWVHHPATNMWRGYERSLLDYQRAICFEWSEIRGYRDTCYEKTVDILQWGGDGRGRKFSTPPWLGDEYFHISHQSNLVRKDPDHYGPIFDCVPDDLEYYWPV